MNTFSTDCFTQCWHCAENPCPRFVDCVHTGQQCDCVDADTAQLERYKRGLLLIEHDIPVVLVGLGTCGLANGGQQIHDALAAECAARGLHVSIIPVGCVGYCAREVIVDVKLPGRSRISYCEVRPQDVPRIVDETIVGGRVLEDKLLGLYAPDETPAWQGLPLISDVPFFRKQMKINLENCGVIDPESIDQYLARGGYAGLSRVLLRGEPQLAIDDVLTAGLRGRGGGGFPTGKKWQFAHDQNSDKKYLICNADEGDPGAFMDRALLEGDPHRVVEGMIIAAYAIGASYGYIYCRAEYPLAIRRLEKTLRDAREYGLLGTNILGSGFSFDMRIKKGAGAFVCGEETALIHSIEGRRGMPRPRPPFPAVSGLFGKPTVINNVETFANVTTIFKRGPEAYARIGTQTSKGTKIFALSGNVCNVGLVEVPMGVSLREIIFDIGGGIPNGKKFKAVQIGGPSGGALPDRVIDTPIDYESLKQVGAMMGSGGMVVMDESTCMVDLAKYFMTFIQSESCGKCIPCREGTLRLLEILERLTRSHRDEHSQEDAMLRFQGMVYLERLASVIKDTSLCGLGQTAANPVMSTLHYFREEYEAHLYERHCPAGACRQLLTYHIDTEKCNGCGVCARKCPEQAILGEKKKAHYIIEDKCIRCDQCRANCNFEAIYVN
ncbi:MAG: NADH-ubiquinone oxidoreductase-F iron-sulfur binding region domain-containing protein [Bacteroidota bacterium]|jgi:NADH:ubiquinone oxidoreductase subunit F (NADH-binding)/(2Fe-2S) ferredoxin|nr:NADH-ubiquinone oxidoreductase-F iron-sulfur binding region domain-containing protein [Bacteroidota bacterium]